MNENDIHTTPENIYKLQCFIRAVRRFTQNPFGAPLRYQIDQLEQLTNEAERSLKEIDHDQD